MRFRQVNNPIYLLGRLHLALWERQNPDAPWMSQGAVHFLDSFIRKEDVGIEFGSGRSTVWFGKRVKRLISIEHDGNWASKVKETIRESGLTNVEHHHIPLDHPEDEPHRQIYDPLPNYVGVINRYADLFFDFVIVDGHYRQACIAAAVPKLKLSGILILDNSNWLTRKEWGIPSYFRVLHQSRNVKSETTVFLKTTPP